MSEDPMSERAQELFGRLVLGEIEASDPKVRDLIDADPDFAGAVEDAKELRASLGRAADDERKAMAAALGEVTGADRATVRAFLAGRARSAQPRPPRWLRVAIAAAAVLAIVFLVPWVGKDGADGSGTGPLDPPDGGVFPVGTVGTVDHFQMPEPLPPGGSAKISVYDNGDPGKALSERPLILESGELRADRWDLDEQEIEALTPRILWILDIWDGTQVKVRTRTYEALIGE